MEPIIQTKENLITQILKRRDDGALSAPDAELIKKMIEKADTYEEASQICGLLNHCYATELRYNYQSAIDLNSDVVRYLKKNTELSFPAKDGRPKHKLVIGDNLYSLIQLLYAKVKVDVIYIDPPYGKDSLGKGAETNYKNSDRDTLLSILHPRLVLAKELLNEDGVIFCSMDDKNHCYLKLIFDKVFEEKNFIADTFVLDNLKGKSNDGFITSVGHKMLVYAKNKEYLTSVGGFNEVENRLSDKFEQKFKFEDDNGIYKEVPFKKSGQDRLRTDRPYSYYPILVKNGVISAITQDEYNRIYDKPTDSFDDAFVDALVSRYKTQGFEVHLPVNTKNELVRWTHSFNGLNKLLSTNGLIYRDGTFYTKDYADEKELLQTYANGVCKSLFYKKEYANGTDNLTSILSACKFSYPKPVRLIVDLLGLIKKKNFVVLDFFAGSGTTGEAVMEFNRQQNQECTFIVCTNNEQDDDTPNGIAHDVTSKRLKRVMTGECYNGDKSFKWLERNTPYEDGLDVFDIQACSARSITPDSMFVDEIDETAYGKKKFDSYQEKLEWLFETFEPSKLRGLKI